MQAVVYRRFTVFKLGAVTLVVSAGLALGYTILKQEPSPVYSNDSNYIYLGHLDDGYCSEQSERYLKRCLTYLRLVKSGNAKLRDYGLSNLANVKKLEDHHFRRIATLCNYDTAIQLARIENVDSRMFSPPMHVHVRIGDIFDILHELYKKYPDDSCNSFFAALAFKTRERLKTMESSLEEELKDKYLSRRGLNLLCLQALIRYSLLGEECCKLMVDKGLISCLLTLRDAFVDDADLTAIIAKLLSQISQYEFARKHFFITGWLGILTEWMRSPDVRIRLPASKVLFNLSDDDDVLGNHMYILHPMYSGENPKYDIIFIHGLLGSIFRTWRQSDSEKERPDYTKCWPQVWLRNDISNLRILAVDYHSTLFERKGDCIPEKRSLEDRGETLIKELLAAGIGKRPIIFVGHSMGGLLIKQMLVNCANSSEEPRKNLLDQVKGIVFYSVPHRGSELARLHYNYQRISLPSLEVRELIKDSPRLLELHDQFSSVALSRPIRFLSFAETDAIRIGVKGVKLETVLVTPESANLGIGPFRILNSNHFNTCKPIDQSSPCYSDLRDFIKDVIAETDVLLSNNPQKWLKKLSNIWS